MKEFNQINCFCERDLRIKNFNIWEVEFTFSSICNYKCDFCPHSNPDFVKKYNKGFMSTKILEKVLDQLKDRKNLFLSVAGMGEPFLNKNFDILIKKLDDFASQTDSELMITTNGLIFQEKFEFFKNLFNNIKTKNFSIRISAYNDKIYNFFNEKNIEYIFIKDMRKKNNNFEFLNNRTGLVNYGSEIEIKTCNYMFYYVMIDADGTLLHCPHDWTRKLTYGNINEKSINDLFFNEKENYFRKLMIENKRDLISPCNICNAKGILLGNNAKKDFQQRFLKNENIQKN